MRLEEKMDRDDQLKKMSGKELIDLLENLQEKKKQIENALEDLRIKRKNSL